MKFNLYVPELPELEQGAVDNRQLLEVVPAALSKLCENWDHDTLSEGVGPKAKIFWSIQKNRNKNNTTSWPHIFCIRGCFLTLFYKNVESIQCRMMPNVK